MNNNAIDEISQRYVHHPRRMKMCFNAVLKQSSWLYSLAWGELDDTINKMRLLSLESYSHNSKCKIHTIAITQSWKAGPNHRLQKKLNLKN